MVGIGCCRPTFSCVALPFIPLNSCRLLELLYVDVYVRVDGTDASVACRRTGFGSGTQLPTYWTFIFAPIF